VRVREEVNLLEVLVAQPVERFLAHAGPGGGGAEQPDDRGALGPPEAGVAPGDDVGRNPPLPVRRPGQRHEAPRTGHVVRDLDRIADGEDVRVARAHVRVDADPPAVANLEPGRPRKRSCPAARRAQG